MTEDELMEHLMMPSVEYEDDGCVWVYWLDQKVDITDKFVDDVCYVKLVNGEETMYVTVKYQNGFAASINMWSPKNLIRDRLSFYKQRMPGKVGIRCFVKGLRGVLRRPFWVARRATNMK